MEFKNIQRLTFRDYTDSSMDLSIKHLFTEGESNHYYLISLDDYMFVKPLNMSTIDTPLYDLMTILSKQFNASVLKGHYVNEIFVNSMMYSTSLKRFAFYDPAAITNNKPTNILKDLEIVIYVLRNAVGDLEDFSNHESVDKEIKDKVSNMYRYLKKRDNNANDIDVFIELIKKTQMDIADIKAKKIIESSDPKLDNIDNVVYLETNLGLQIEEASNVVSGINGLAKNEPLTIPNGSIVEENSSAFRDKELIENGIDQVVIEESNIIKGLTKPPSSQVLDNEKLSKFKLTKIENGNKNVDDKSTILLIVSILGLILILGIIVINVKQKNALQQPETTTSVRHTI